MRYMLDTSYFKILITAAKYEILFFVKVKNSKILSWFPRQIFGKNCISDLLWAFDIFAKIYTYTQHFLGADSNLSDLSSMSEEVNLVN